MRISDWSSDVCSSDLSDFPVKGYAASFLREPPPCIDLCQSRRRRYVGECPYGAGKPTHPIPPHRKMGRGTAAKGGVEGEDSKVAPPSPPPACGWSPSPRFAWKGFNFPPRPSPPAALHPRRAPRAARPAQSRPSASTRRSAATPSLWSAPARPRSAAATKEIGRAHV